MSEAAGNKKEATEGELAQPVIQDRKVAIRNVQTEADGFIRNKNFRNCDIIGPAILLPSRSEFAECVFDVAGIRWSRLSGRPIRPLLSW
jgi:hypothetical protein